MKKDRQQKEGLLTRVFKNAVMVFNATFNNISVISWQSVVFNATFNNISVISWQSVVFNATFNNISVISWRSVLFKRELKRWNNGNSNVSPLKQNGLKQEKYIQTYI